MGCGDVRDVESGRAGHAPASPTIGISSSPPASDVHTDARRRPGLSEAGLCETQQDSGSES